MSVFPKKTTKKLNVADLQRMTAPITVRIMRIGPTGNTPIPLERLADNLPAGAGWTPEQVVELDGRLLLEYAGGGNYEISATDATGNTIEWPVSYDARQFPSKIPSALLFDGGVVESAMNNISNLSPPLPTMPTNGGASGGNINALGYVPEGNVPMQREYMQASQPVYTPPNFQPIFQQGRPVPPQPQQQQAYYPWGYPPPIAGAGHATPDQERARLEAKVVELERKAMEERYHQQLAQQKLEADRKLDELKSEIARSAHAANTSSVSDTIAKTLNDGLKAIGELVVRQAPSGPSPELQAMQQQLLQMQEATRAAQAENLRIREQAESRERERASDERHRQAMDAMQQQMRDANERTQRTIDEMKLMVTTNRGPDPIISLVQENMRMMSDTMKSVSMQQENSLRQVASNVISPIEIMRMMKDNSNGTEDLTRNIAGAYSNMFTMFREATQNLMQLSPQGDSPVIRVLEGAIEKASGMAQSYVAAQRDQGMAQAQVAKAQMAAQTQIAQAQVDIARAQQGGIALPAPGQAPTAALPQSPGVGQAEAPVIADNGPKTHGKSDRQWFGVAFDNVMVLRANVAAYLDATSVNPPKRNEKGDILGLHTTQVAQIILQAAAEMQKAGIEIPVFKLFASEQYADMFDILLPDAPQAYRDECVRLLTRSMDPSTSVFPSGDEPEPKAIHTATMHAPQYAVATERETQYENEDEEEDEDAPAPMPVPAPVPAPLPVRPPLPAPVARPSNSGRGVATVKRPNS